MESTKKAVMAKDITITSILIAVGVIMPSIFHMLQLGGAVFLPMHIPVLMCGFLVGRRYGLLCGVMVPLLSSVTTGMPPLFPVAIGMSIELGAYGYVSGVLSKKTNTYVALIGAQVIGRLVGAVGQVILLGMIAKPFVLESYMTAVFITSIPGILLQLILIPAGLLFLKKIGTYGTN